MVSKHSSAKGQRLSRTHSRVGVGDGSIRSNSLVLAVDEHPETDVFGSVAVLASDLSAEVDKGLRFEHSVGGKVGSGNGAVVKGGEVEALVALERLVGDDLYAESAQRIGRRSAEDEP